MKVMLTKRSALGVVFVSIIISLLVVRELNSYRATIPAFPSPTPIREDIQKETVNWKTYSNDKYKVSFKFPAEYSLVESPTKDTLYVGPAITMSFQLYPKPRLMSLDSAIQDGLRAPFKNYWTIQVDGIRGIHEIPQAEGQKDYLYFDYDNAVLVVETTFAKGQYNADLFSKIIYTTHWL